MSRLSDYFKKQAEIETTLCFRHPWFNLFYNWLVLACVVALFISFGIWGMDIKAQRMVETAYASWQADQQAEDEEIIRSQESIMDMEAQAVAKAFYGIRLFVEKYNYNESDLETYARCMFNRAESGDLEKVVRLTGQFTGYSDDNPVIEGDYNLALRLVKEWHSETVKPVDVAYVYAELTPEGIFLRKDFHADAYQRRWHA